MSSAAVPQSVSSGTPKRPWKGVSNWTPKKKQKKAVARPEGTHDEVLHAELRNLSLTSTSTFSSPDQQDTEQVKLPEPFTETEVTITTLSSTGDGIGFSSHTGTHPYIVPFSLPGDTVTAKVIRHTKDTTAPLYTTADFVKVIKPSSDRNDSLVKCKYFSICSGCQFQMASYDYQLKHKRRIVVDAYKHFSHIPTSLIPDVRDTLPSPLQYGYRTKLTPHFDGPAGGRRKNRNGETPRFESVPPIGFMKKGTRHTLDIEECPIGTDIVQRGITRERAKVVRQLDTYRKGVTILLRENTQRFRNGEQTPAPPDPLSDDGKEGADIRTLISGPDYTTEKTCISDPRAESTEYVGDWEFRNPANAFFQNNNSILPPFTEYIREQIIAYNDRVASEGRGKPATTLIDAYSGSGLFTIALSQLFTASIGIDISAESIAYARKNATLNGVSAAPASPASHADAAADADAADKDDKAKGNVRFLASTASDIFAAVPASFDPASTVVVIDPPRKGCDEDFLSQLVKFGPALIVYVSCNVHTQARDVGWVLRNTDRRRDVTSAEPATATEDGLDSVYEIESLRGCDFFPQTGHVEGVAVLRRKMI